MPKELLKPFLSQGKETRKLFFPLSLAGTALIQLFFRFRG